MSGILETSEFLPWKSIYKFVFLVDRAWFNWFTEPWLHNPYWVGFISQQLKFVKTILLNHLSIKSKLILRTQTTICVGPKFLPLLRDGGCSNFRATSNIILAPSWGPILDPKNGVHGPCPRAGLESNLELNSTNTTIILIFTTEIHLSWNSIIIFCKLKLKKKRWTAL